MTTITGEETPLDLNGHAHAPADESALEGTNEEGDFAAELKDMSTTAERLQAAGLLTADEVVVDKEETERTRRRYEELSPEERRAVNRRLREQGRRILERKVSGAPVVEMGVVINHNRLVPVLETWWAFLNRMSVNMARFGSRTFDGQKQADTVSKWFDDQQVKLREYVNEQLDVSKAFVELAEENARVAGRTPLRPTISQPALTIHVEAFTAYSHELLETIVAFDQVMGYFDAMVFNRVRDQRDIDDEVTRFINKLRPVGVRGLITHRKLMLTIQNLH